MALAYQIISGPSKFDLMVSLFHGEGMDRQMVHFDYERPTGTETLSIYIWSVEREGTNSVEEWVIQGVDRNLSKFSITFSTKTRKGRYWPKRDDS